MTAVRPEFRDQVMTMWNDGQTSGQIGAALGITRNAVIGIVQRFKGPKRKSNANFVSQAGKPKPRRPKGPSAPPRIATAEPNVDITAPPSQPLPRLFPLQPVVTAKPAKPGKPCGILDIADGCRWPIADAPDVIGGYLFCNSQCAGEQSYCAQHARQAIAPYSGKLITKTIAGARAAYKSYAHA